MSSRDVRHHAVVPPKAVPPRRGARPISPTADGPGEDGAGLSRERQPLDLFPDAYFGTDLTGRILEANTAAGDLLALCPGDLEGASLLDFVAPADADRIAALLSGDLSAAQAEPLEARVSSVAGRSVLAEIRVRPESRGERRVQLMWFVRDVTRQRETERALSARAERHLELATSMPVLTYYLDGEHPGGVTTFVSPLMAELLGFRAEDWLSHPELWIRQIHPEDRTRALAERAGAYEKVSEMRCEYRVLTRDGLVRWVRDEAHVVSDDRVPKVEGVVIDVSGRAGGRDDGLPLESRRKALPPVQDGNTRTFLRLFLHDVRSPLSVSVAIVDMLLRDEDGLPVDQRRDLLYRAKTNLEHIHHLLAEVVEIERLEQRQVAVRREPTDVTTVVERVVRAVGETDHPVTFRGSDCIVHTDASLVERAVTKLLDNAFTHTPPATEIWVEVEDVENGVLVTVDDEGTGVPDEVKERIFEAFDRGNAPVTTAGFGLGLALVRHIAHVLGGETWVEDRPGGGASFRILLPAGPL